MKSNHPYVISTRDLPSGAGNMRQFTLTAPVPADWSTALISVSPGDITLDITVQQVTDGILVNVSSCLDLQGQCGRCLQDITDQLDVDICQLYYFPHIAEQLIAQGDEDAKDEPVLQKEQIDLEPLLRDYVLPELPYQPLCNPDCAGLCPGCGQKWADLPADHEHVVIDPRWSALEDLATQLGAQTENGNASDSQ